MLRLQAYILRRLAANLVLVLAVLSTVVFVTQTVVFLQRTPDLGLGFVLTVLPLFLPVTLSITLPLAFLVATLFTYGRMSDDNEVLAVRMSGIHPWALLSPGVCAGAALSLACLVLQGSLAPAALAGQDGFRMDVYKRFVQLVEGGGRSSFGNGDFKISWRSVESGALRDVHISKGGIRDAESQEIHAGSAVLQRDAQGRVLVFALRDVTVVSGSANDWVPARFDEWTFSVSASELLDARTGLPHRRALDYPGLLFRSHRWPRTETGMLARVEMFSRAALGFAPLVFALAGIPLALLLGRGSRAAAGVLAFGVALAFFLLWQAGEATAVRGSLPIPVALLGGDVLLSAGGLGLFALFVRR